jgi:hypothetical protein
MMSTSGVPSNTYTKKYVEVARAAGEEWGSVNIF